MKRPCIEVKDTSSILRDNDPITHFVYMLNDEHKQNDVLEDNITLLKTLITNGHIAKSSIIIDNDHICKIYGLSIGDDGRIVYERSPQLQDRGRRVGIKLSSLDLSSLKRSNKHTHGQMGQYVRHG
jgi:hypothetical protein